MKKALFFAAAVAALISCSKEIAPVESNEIPEGFVELTLTARMDAANKAVLDGTIITWQAGEEVAVFTSASTAPNKFTVKDADWDEVTITGAVPAGATSFIAAYPYKHAVSCSGSQVKMNIPASQTVPDGACCDPDALMSVAYFPSASASGVVFRNVFSLLEFNVNAADIERAKFITGEAGGFAGDITVNVSTSGAPTVSGGAGSVEVCAASTFTKDQSYFAVVAPGTVDGLSANIYKGTYKSVMSSDVSMDVARNEGLNLGNIAKKTTWKFAVIKTANDLRTFLGQAATYEATDEIEIGNDLNLSGVTITPAASFAGVLDGRGCSIKNWTSKGVTLFDVNTGVIKNVVFDSSCKFTAPTSLGTGFGFLAATNSGQVIGCVNNAPVTGNVTFGTEAYLGAIVGTSTSGALVDACVNNGNVTINFTPSSSNTTYLGGVCGRVYASEIRGCENYGNLTYAAKKATPKNFYIGGVTGSTNDKSQTDYCKNYGSLTFHTPETWGAMIMGGVTSYTAGSITGCENYGSVTYKSDKYIQASLVGGIAGYCAGPIVNCSNSGSVYVESTAFNGRNAVGNYKDYAGATDQSKVYSKYTASLVVAGICGGGAPTKDGTFSATGCENSGNVTFKLTKMDQFALAGDPYPGGTLDKNRTPASEARMRVAGIIADAAGPVSDSNNSGTITIQLNATTAPYKVPTAGYTSYVAGIVAANYNSVNQSECAITNCTNSGKIVYNSDSNHNKTYNCVGGIVGWPGKEAAARTTAVTGCTNTGDINVSNGVKMRVGGISATSTTVTNCINRGKVYCDSHIASNIGGVIGFLGQGYACSGCKNYGTVETSKTLLNDTSYTEVDAGGATVSFTTCGSVSGLVANVSNSTVNVTNCEAHCTVITRATVESGMVIGDFTASSTAAITASGKVSGKIGNTSSSLTTLTSSNFSNYLVGTKNYNSSIHTLNYTYGE